MGRAGRGGGRPGTGLHRRRGGAPDLGPGPIAVGADTGAHPVPGGPAVQRHRQAAAPGPPRGGASTVIGLDEEHLELRRTVRDFLQAVSPETEVRRLMDTPEGHDQAVWLRLCTELGLAGLAVPEEYGGSGYGPVEVGVVMEELGRSLACVPYLSSAVLATTALLLSADEPLCKELLPAMVAGELLATVAVAEQSGRWAPDELATTAVQGPEGWQLSGEKLFVLDGCTADVILVFARHDDGAVSLFAVPGRAVQRTPMT